MSASFHIHTHIHTYIHTYIHKHTQVPPLSGDARFLEDVSASLIDIGSVAPVDSSVERAREERRSKSGSSKPPPSNNNDGWGLFRN